MSEVRWVPTITAFGIATDFFFANGVHVGLIVFGGFALALLLIQRGEPQ